MVLFLYLARYMEHPDVGCRTTSLALGSILCSLFITNSLTLLLSLSKIWTSEGRFTMTLVIIYYLARYMEHPDVGCGTTSLALGSILCSLFITNSLSLLLSLSKIWTSEGRFTLTLVIIYYLARYMEHPDVSCGTTSLALGSILCSLFITNSLALLLSLLKIWTSEGRFTMTLVIIYYLARYMEHPDVRCGTTSLALGSILCSLFITNSLALLLSLCR